MQKATQTLNAIMDNVSKVVIGKQHIVRLAMISIISNGHVLIEDIPGVGKTSLVSGFAKSIDLSFKRIQFTPDVTPSDVVGFSMYNPKTMEFEYKKGAVLNQFVQADEINRTSSKTQASLLEVMEEQQVTVDGNTYKAPSPFIVFATQNPMEHVGTYPLPESQLDRFFMCISLGYPSLNDEANILLNQNAEHAADVISSVSTAEEILRIQTLVKNNYIAPEVAAYVVRIADATRNHPDISLGASPRASIHLCKAAKACAILNGRNYVIPDDVQSMTMPVLSHRIIIKKHASSKNINTEAVLAQILKALPVPIPR